MSIEVSCLCGDCKMTLEGDPLTQVYCHCDDCQAVHGAAYIPIAMFPHEAVHITQGETETWTYKTNPRTRCKTCGTILFAEPPRAPFKGVKANLLPEGMFKPEFHIMCQDAVLPVKDSLPHFKGFPKRFGGSDDVVNW